MKLRNRHSAIAFAGCKPMLIVTCEPIGGGEFHLDFPDGGLLQPEELNAKVLYGAAEETELGITHL